MTQDIDQLIKSFTNNQDKESLVEIFRNTTLTLEIYNQVCSHLPVCDSIGQWLLDGWGDNLWEKTKNPHEWRLWGGPKSSVRYCSLDVDAVLAGSDGSGRWFDYFCFRWDETHDLFVGTLNEKGQSNRQVFFETAWHYAIVTENITVLHKMFGSTPWCAALCNPNPIKCFYFPPCFERSSPEVVNVLVQSEIIPFETVLHKQLEIGARNDILQVLLNDDRATPEFVVQEYIQHWHTPYYETAFSNTLNEFINNFVTPQDIAVLHHKIVEQCFLRDRRDLPKSNPQLFVEHLKNTPLLDDTTFVCAMLARFDELHPRSAATDVLEIFVTHLTQKDWGHVVAQYPNNEFLRRLPRGQKHILLQQIDCQGGTADRRKI